MANFQLKINIFAYFALLSTFTGSICAFLSTHQSGKVYCKTEHRQSQPSFIDINEVIDKEISVNYNSGLGKERLLYVDDDIAAVFKIDRVDKMIVHRLDYATSGLVIFARNDNALTSLHTQFRQRNKVYKRYSAIVKGNVKYFDGEIDLPLGKQVECPPLCKVDPFHGKVSTTTWSLFGTHGGNSHIHLIPHTGRYVLDIDQHRLILCYG
jgi:RNA pseudouridylate synthase